MERSFAREQFELLHPSGEDPVRSEDPQESARANKRQQRRVNMECPKCGYMRTDKDMARPGECPRCGIIYAKYENHEETASYSPPVKEHVPEKSGGIGAKAVIAVVALCCLVGGYPLLSPKSKKSPPVTGADVENARVVLLSTTWCGYCKKAKTFLENNKIAFLELDVESSKEGQRMYSELNGRGVPVVLIGDTRIDGFSEQAMHQALVKDGLL